MPGAPPALILIGLGPGDPLLLTRAAWQALHQAAVIYTPVPQHPALAEFGAAARPLAVDSPNAQAASAQMLAAEAAEAAAKGSGRVVCALPGHPADSDLVAVLRALVAGSGRTPVDLQLIPGLASTDPRHQPQPAPDSGVQPWCTVQGIGPYVPPDLGQNHTRDRIGSLHAVVVRLLGPGGCPWDVQQTHQDLRAGLLEEAYEVLEALDAQDMPALAEELGDLLVQVLIQSEMARQAGHFDLGNVLEQITAKLVRRHPHVFGTLAVAGMGEVLGNWEAIKAQELAAKGRERTSALDGVPAGLPALAAAQKIGAKAARVGFDWPTLRETWAKVTEEFDELAQAQQAHAAAPSAASQAHVADECGDVLYVVVQLARWLGVDAESALRQANAKFRRRFRAVEQAAQARGQSIAALSLEEALALWAAAKAPEQQVEA